VLRLTFENGRDYPPRQDQFFFISQLSRLTFENRRDCPSCRDQLLKTVEIESLDRDHVKTNRDPQGYHNMQKSRVELR